MSSAHQRPPCLIYAKVAHVRAQARKPHRAHHCHAAGCTKDVPPAYFMCAPHWRMVPHPLQVRIWATYNPGQEDGEAGVSKEYLEAHDAATAAVAAKEGRRA